MLPKNGASDPLNTPPSVDAVQYEVPLRAGAMPTIGLDPWWAAPPSASPNPDTVPAPGGGAVVPDRALTTVRRVISPQSTRLPESPVLLVVASGPGGGLLGSFDW